MKNLTTDQQRELFMVLEERLTEVLENETVQLSDGLTLELGDAKTQAGVVTVPVYVPGGHVLLGHITLTLH